MWEKPEFFDKPQNRYLATPWRPQERQELENDQKNFPEATKNHQNWDFDIYQKWAGKARKTRKLMIIFQNFPANAAKLRSPSGAQVSQKWLVEHI